MASGGIRLEIQNLDEVKRLLEQLGPRAKAALPAGVEAGAEVLAARMAGLAPGPHIGTEQRYNGGGRVIYYVGPDKAHWYYRFFETGTSAHEVRPKSAKALHWGGGDEFAMRTHPSGMAAQPFMRPAVDEGRDEVAAKIGEVIRAALE